MVIYGQPIPQTKSYATANNLVESSDKYVHGNGNFEMSSLQQIQVIKEIFHILLKNCSAKFVTQILL